MQPISKAMPVSLVLWLVPFVRVGASDARVEGVPPSQRGQDARDTAPHAVAMNVPADYAIGADLSFLKQAEDRGTLFKDHGQAKPGLRIFRDHGYNWRPTVYKNKEAPFPETPEGRRQFLEQVHRAVLETPHGLGKGVFWWEPAVAGPLRSRGFFDDDDALPVITGFDKRP